MRIKYIIVAVLGMAGVLFGAWNWMSYFKGQAGGGGAPQLQAVRPSPNPAIAQLEQQAAATPGTAAEPEKKNEDRVPQGEKMEFPDTLGRNPFLTPEEIRLIASGQLIKEAPPPVVNTGPLPELTISALLKDNVSGDFVALIGGKAYRQGQMIGQEEVVRITENSVVLESSGGRRRTLNIGGKQPEKGVSIKMRKN